MLESTPEAALALLGLVGAGCATHEALWTYPSFDYLGCGLGYSCVGANYFDYNFHTLFVVSNRVLFAIGCGDGLFSVSVVCFHNLPI